LPAKVYSPFPEWVIVSKRIQIVAFPTAGFDNMFLRKGKQLLGKPSLRFVPVKADRLSQPEVFLD